MKKIITDDYEFEHIIGGKAVYVDKTDLLARMASGRPRRVIAGRADAARAPRPRDL